MCVRLFVDREANNRVWEYHSKGLEQWGGQPQHVGVERESMSWDIGHDDAGVKLVVSIGVNIIVSSPMLPVKSKLPLFQSSNLPVSL